MAMTKSEKAYVQSLERQLSFCFTPDVKPDVPPPTGVGQYTSGWIVLGSGEHARAERAWSSAVSHGWGTDKPGPRMSASQNAIWLYSSKSLALRAARRVIEEHAATLLYRIDQQIAECDNEN